MHARKHFEPEFSNDRLKNTGNCWQFSVQPPTGANARLYINLGCNQALNDCLPCKNIEGRRAIGCLDSGDQYMPKALWPDHPSCLWARDFPRQRDEREKKLSSRAFIFPGQGSQDVGMGKAIAEAFPAARAVFEEVDEALGEKLSQLIWDGPKDQLTLTANAQPALMAVSMAIIRVLEAEQGLDLAKHVSFVAGHSLGEYSALAAAGTFKLGDAARLLRARGKAMQAAVPVGEGAMVALLGVGMDVAKVVASEAAQGEVCQVANDNDPTQVVLSGAKAAIDRVAEVGKAHNVRRAIPLPVSAPFHCAMMQPAAVVMAEALGEVEMLAPKVPVVANVTAQPTTDPDKIRAQLIAQVTGTVRWRECMLAMIAAGVTNFYEVGSGKVLSGLVRRIERSAEGQTIGSPDEIAAMGGILGA